MWTENRRESVEDLNKLKEELEHINNKRIKLETLVDQAKKQCKEIEEKYHITNEHELKVLVDNAEAAYLQKLTEAANYLEEVKQAFIPYENLL